MDDYQEVEEDSSYGPGIYFTTCVRERNKIRGSATQLFILLGTTFRALSCRGFTVLLLLFLFQKFLLQNLNTIKKPSFQNSCGFPGVNLII